MFRFSSQTLFKMEKAIEVLKKELRKIEYLYSNYERAGVLQHIDADGMQTRINALKYSIELLESVS